MCGRYVSPKQATIDRQWHIGRHNQPTLLEPFAARYNVAPQQGNPANYVPVVRQAEDGELEVEMKCARLQWALTLGRRLIAPRVTNDFFQLQSQFAD